MCIVLQSEATVSWCDLSVLSSDVVQSCTQQIKPQYIRDSNFVVPQ